MALTIRVRIEENKKELNIVIWHEDKADKVASIENPIVNLKIPVMKFYHYSFMDNRNLITYV